MARGAQKRVSQANQRAVATLAYGFLVSNTLFVLAACLRRQTSPWRTWTLYGITEFLAALIAWKLVAMAQVGDDLSLPGMTAYVKESSYSQVYVRLCVHYMVCARRCCTRITAVLVDLCGGMFLFFFARHAIYLCRSQCTYRICSTKMYLCRTFCRGSVPHVMCHKAGTVGRRHPKTKEQVLASGKPRCRRARLGAVVYACRRVEANCVASKGATQ